MAHGIYPRQGQRPHRADVALDTLIEEVQPQPLPDQARAGTVYSTRLTSMVLDVVTGTTCSVKSVVRPRGQVTRSCARSTSRAS